MQLAANTVCPSCCAAFWDCDFEQLDWDLQRSFIVGRMLAAGTWEAVMWLRGQLGDDALRQWIQDHEGRLLTSQQLRSGN